MMQKIEEIQEIITDGIANFSFSPKTPLTDISKYPFKEPPIFLVVYHPDNLVNMIKNGKDASYTGHVAMVYDGICIDSQQVEGTNKKGLTSTNTSSFNTVFGRIQRKEANPPYVYMLFPSELGIKPADLKKRMMAEAQKTNDYDLFKNNCVHHAFRALLGSKQAHKEFGKFFTPREALQWCDKACKKGAGIRVKGEDVLNYLYTLSFLYHAHMGKEAQNKDKVSQQNKTPAPLSVGPVLAQYNQRARAA